MSKSEIIRGEPRYVKMRCILLGRPSVLPVRPAGLLCTTSEELQARNSGNDYYYDSGNELGYDLDSGYCYGQKRSLEQSPVTFTIPVDDTVTNPV